MAIAGAACSDPPTSSGGDDRGQQGAGAGDGLPDCPVDALDDAAGPVEVTLWYGGIGGPTQQALEDMVAAFNAGQSEVVVTASDQGASFAEVNRKFESAAAAGADQLPDLVMLENTQLQALSDSGLVLPAEACMDAAGYDVTDIEPAVRAAFSVDDVLYPGYMNVSSQVLHYNKAHWVRAGLDPDAPPRTLDELHAQARALKEAGVSSKPLSFKVSHAVFENWLSGEGVEVVGNDNGHDGLATEARLDDPVAVETLAFLQQMHDEGLLNVFASTEGGIDQFLALVTQESSMLIETSTASTTIAEAVSGELTPAEAGVDFDASIVDRADLVPGTGAFPGISGPGQVHPGGGGFFIVSSSAPEQQAGSWALLEYMLEPANAQAWHLRGGYLPAVKAVQDEPAVQAFWEDDLAGVLLRPAVEQLRGADPDEPGPLVGPFPDFADALEDAVEAVLFDDADPAAALARAQDTVTESL
ncbi:MAG: extracellular solute-binding protein, partial [Acidimicrobiales bacterium]|nr:extracellular solute-binding protein [Acidimicrobiales bacterium]